MNFYISHMKKIFNKISSSFFFEKVKDKINSFFSHFGKIFNKMNFPLYVQKLFSKDVVSFRMYRKNRQKAAKNKKKIVRIIIVIGITIILDSIFKITTGFSVFELLLNFFSSSPQLLQETQNMVKKANETFDNFEEVKKEISQDLEEVKKEISQIKEDLKAQNQFKIKKFMPMVASIIFPLLIKLIEFALIKKPDGKIKEIELPDFIDYKHPDYSDFIDYRKNKKIFNDMFDKNEDELFSRYDPATQRQPRFVRKVGDLLAKKDTVWKWRWW